MSSDDPSKRPDNCFKQQRYGVPSAFFAVVQLSSWFTQIPRLLAQLRDSQVVSANKIINVAYATNADYGGGLHPPYKQHCGQRLANAALSMVYSKPVNWRSPTYASAEETGSGEVTVSLHDVLDAGLTLKIPFNLRTAGRRCLAANNRTPQTCAWSSIQFDDASKTWVNATVSLSADRNRMVLTAPSPSGATNAIATSYGWGSIPMLSVYRADMEGKDGQLPVLPWNRTL